VDFYAAAAQVIPVFFLAMAFDSRSLMRLPTSYDAEADPLDPALWNSSQIIGTMYLVVLMACGEVSALVALSRNGTSSVIDALVWLGIVGGLLGVVLPVLDHQRILLKRHLKAVGGSGQVLFLGFVLICLIFLTATVIGWFAN
jgi:hypothetical protein